ncbi:MAG: site-specific integrase [Alphaproteobacteria bacterium]|nr:site-specific integrase [Alphaproteobacteria bacterium]
MEKLHKVSGHTRLYRRGATYYHRAAVPKGLLATYGKAEETFSLKTKDHAEALRRVRIAAVEVDQRFDEHRRRLDIQSAPAVHELSTDQLANIKQAYLHHLVDEDEEIRLDGFEEADDPSIGGFSAEPPHLEPRPTFDEYNELVEDMGEVSRHNLARGKQDAFFRGEAEDVLSWNGVGIRLSPQSPDWRMVVRALQEASVEASGIVAKRSEGQRRASCATPQEPARRPLRATVSPLLSQAIDEWATERNRTGVWSPKVADDYMYWAKAFVEVAGDRPINDYAKADARAFKALLLKLPSNWRKMPATRKGAIIEAAEKSAAYGLKVIAPTTINKALNRIGAFWIWAGTHYDEVAGDLMAGLHAKVNTKAKDQRNPLSLDQLNKLFNSPLFTGCRSEKFRSQPGKVDMSHTAWFWLPILSLFNGARLNELCQLDVGDVQEEDGIPFLKLTDEGEYQRNKTNLTRRSPLHPVPLKLGFLSFVSQRRQRGPGLLFAGLKRGNYGYYSDAMTKNFSAYLKAIGAKTEKTSFHSLRHNFEDACRNSRVEWSIMNALQGHAEKGQGGRYGDGYHLEVLKAEMDKLAYPGLDLSRINGFRGS